MKTIMYLDYSNEFNISSQVRLRFLHLPLIEERLGFLLEINKNFFYKSQIGSYRTFLFQGTRDLSSPWHKKSNKFSNIHSHLLRARIVFKRFHCVQQTWPLLLLETNPSLARDKNILDTSSYFGGQS